MANKKVTLVWYCKVPGRGWRYFPAVYHIKDAMLTPKPGWAKENGVGVEYPQGRFMLRSYDAEGRNIYVPVTEKNPHIVQNRLRSAQIRAIDRPKALDNLSVLKRAADAYVRDCKARKAMEAARDAKLVLGEFTAMANRTYIKGITREIVLDYHERLRRKGNSERTISNKHNRLFSFFRFCKADVSFMPPQPKYEKKLPNVYTSTDTAALLNAADEHMQTVILMGLKMGLRELEICHAEWPDIHRQDSVFRVQGKPHWKFKIKDSEQRDVPIPADVLEHLRLRREKYPASRLIVGTKSDRPNFHLLRTLKRLARRAGLNCGECKGCKTPQQECENFQLHKLRRTYGTTLLRSGVDVRSVQAWMGHADLATTLRYLRPSAAKESQDKVNAIIW